MYVTKPMMESLAPILPTFVTMAMTNMEQNMMLYQDIIIEGPSSRFKTIGVEYDRILPPGAAVTDDMPIENME